MCISWTNEELDTIGFCAEKPRKHILQPVTCHET